MISRLLSILFLLILLSCDEERKSRLFIPPSPEGYSKPKNDILPKISTKHFPHQKKETTGVLPFWDEFNLSQLKKIFVPKEVVQIVSEKDFEFSIELDSATDYTGKLIKNGLLFKGKIKNNSKYDLFFLSSSCNGLADNLKVNNFNSIYYGINCNYSIAILNILKSEEVFEFSRIIAPYQQVDKINSSIIIDLVSSDVSLSKTKALKTIILKAEKEEIPVHLNYIYKEGSN